MSPSESRKPGGPAEVRAVPTCVKTWYAQLPVPNELPAKVHVPVVDIPPKSPTAAKVKLVLGVACMVWKGPKEAASKSKAGRTRNRPRAVQRFINHPADFRSMRFLPLNSF